MSSFKRWFNQRLWSHRIRTGRGRLYEICGHAWCMRLAHYDHLVKEIRQRHAGGITYAALARVFGVDARTISGICKRKLWKQVE